MMMTLTLIAIDDLKAVWRCRGPTEAPEELDGLLSLHGLDGHRGVFAAEGHEARQQPGQVAVEHLFELRHVF